MKNRLKHVSPAINRALSRLRNGIRKRVLFEGVLALLFWTLLTFLAFSTVDYLLVLSGVNELSKTARAILLLGIGGLLAWTFYQQILRRIFKRLSNSSMALLIERRFPSFNDSLITTVDYSKGTDDESELLIHARQQAEAELSDVNLAEIFDSRSLKRLLYSVVALLILVASFAAIRFDSFCVAAQRLYQLDDQLWPRQCQVELVSVRVDRENPISGVPDSVHLSKIENGEILVAKGANVKLLAHAKTQGKWRAPQKCVMRYWNDEGARGRQVLKRVGVPKDGFQNFVLDGRPLDGLLSNTTFTLRGGDHRIGPLKFSIVGQPVVVKTELDCEYPNYMVDQQSLRWTPRTVTYTGPTVLPQGTSILIRCESSKPLAKIFVTDPDDNLLTTLNPAKSSHTRFEFSIPMLTDDQRLRFYLCDTDGIVAETAHSVALRTVLDAPPIVKTRLYGIGTAITPDAIVPIQGTVSDDYQVANTWIDLQTPGTTESKTEIETASGKINTAIDFRRLRQSGQNEFPLTANGNQQVSIKVSSRDKFDLTAEPNIGSGDRYVLDVVSPGQLLKILERMEVGGRQRLEQIFSEMDEARNYLLRTRIEKVQLSSAHEPGEEFPKEAEPDSKASKKDRAQQNELRLLFAQRAFLQVEKSAQELSGVAETFDSIRLQLVHNRLDSEDREQRLAQQVVAPLNSIANDSMVELTTKINTLEEFLASDKARNDVAANSAIESVDKVLSELDAVLGNLVKFETQNELLDIVRRMIDQQKQLMERTKKERQRKAFEGLLD